MRVYTSLTKNELLEMGFKADPPSSTWITIGSQYGLISSYFDERGGTLQWYIDFQPMSHVDPTLPAAIEDLLPELGNVTFKAHVGSLGCRVARAVGDYRHRTASMRWTAYVGGVYASSSSFVDLCEMLYLFHSGSLRPVHELGGRQVETTPKEFRQLLREFFWLLKRQMSEWKFRIDRWQPRQP